MIIFMQVKCRVAWLRILFQHFGAPRAHVWCWTALASFLFCKADGSGFCAERKLIVDWTDTLQMGASLRAYAALLMNGACGAQLPCTFRRISSKKSKMKLTLLIEGISASGVFITMTRLPSGCTSKFRFGPRAVN